GRLLLRASDRVLSARAKLSSVDGLEGGSEVVGRAEEQSLLRDVVEEALVLVLGLVITIASGNGPVVVQVVVHRRKGLIAVVGSAGAAVDIAGDRPVLVEIVLAAHAGEAVHPRFVLASGEGVARKRSRRRESQRELGVRPRAARPGQQVEPAPRVAKHSKRDG